MTAPLSQLPLLSRCRAAIQSAWHSVRAAAGVARVRHSNPNAVIVVDRELRPRPATAAEERVIGAEDRAEMSAADLRALVPADMIGLGPIKMTPARERALELARASRRATA